MRKLVLPLAAVLLLAAGYLLAQTSEPATQHMVMTPDGKLVMKGKPDAPEPKSLPALPPGSVVPLDNQLSLRIDGEYQGKVIGTLMVKHNGRWSEVILGGGNTYVKTR